MTTLLTPRSPTWAGLDWPVTRQGGVVLDSSQRVYAALIHSLAAETINAYSTFVEKYIGDAPLLQLDVWPVASLPETASGGTPMFDPNEDVSVVGCTGVSNNTAGQLYQNIDEGAALNTADYVRMNTAVGAVVTYACRVGSAAGLGAGAQNVSRIGVQVDGTGYNTPGQIQFEITDGSSVYTSGWIPVNPSNVTTLYSHDFVSSLDVALSEAFVQALDGAGSVTFRWQPFTSGTNFDFEIRRLRVAVEYTDDARVVSTAFATPSAQNSWLTFNFANWAKANGTDYLAVIRRVSSGTAIIPTLDSEAVHPGSHRLYVPDVSSAGVITALNDPLTEVPPFVMHTTAPADSVDSQPYNLLRLEEVRLGRTVVQEITEPSGATRGLIQVIAASDVYDGPDQPLTGKIRATATGVQQGGDASFDPALIADDFLALHVLQRSMAATVALTNGTQYDLEFSSLAQPDRPWVVAILDTQSPPLTANLTGFGGTTDRGEIATAESDNLDLPGALFSTVPAAPTWNGAGAVAALAGGLGTIVLTWNTTALGGSFAGYLIERLHGTVWYPVALIGLEATLTWTDTEARQGVAESYRIRSVHTNGTFSLPSATASATAGGLKYALSSNRQTSLNQAVTLDRPSPLRKPREQVDSVHFGRRFPTLTSSARNRGAQLDTKIHTVVSGTSRGLSMFDALEPLLDSLVPYLCLRDPWGGRKFVGLVHDGGDQTIMTYGTANAKFIEITDVPDEVTA